MCVDCSMESTQGPDSVWKGCFGHGWRQLEVSGRGSCKEEERVSGISFSLFFRASELCTEEAVEAKAVHDSSRERS